MLDSPSHFRAACVRGKSHQASHDNSANGRADLGGSRRRCVRSLGRGGSRIGALRVRCPRKGGATITLRIQAASRVESEPRLDGHPKGTRSCEGESRFPFWPLRRCWQVRPGFATDHRVPCTPTYCAHPPTDPCSGAGWLAPGCVRLHRTRDETYTLLDSRITLYGRWVLRRRMPIGGRSICLTLAIGDGIAPCRRLRHLGGK
jgi:hypothetical protein